jgi:extradiol dioxygenase family protein
MMNTRNTGRYLIRQSINTDEWQTFDLWGHSTLQVSTRSTETMEEQISLTKHLIQTGFLDRGVVEVSEETFRVVAKFPLLKK